MQHHLRVSLLTAGAALSIAMIAGCSSPTSVDDSAVEPAPAGQTVEEACNEILDPIVALGEQMEALEENATSDPQSVVDGFELAADDLGSISTSIENAEVKSTLDTAVTSLDGVATSMQEIIDDPENADLEAFQESLTSIVADFSAIDTLCGGQ